MLRGKVPGRLIDNLPKRFKFHDDEVDAEISGLLDECLDLGQGQYAALDNKTRASAPESTIHAYQVQMDVYTLLLEKNGYKTKRVAYLAYFYPTGVNDGKFDFGIHIKELKTDPDEALKLFHEAVGVIKSDTEPQPRAECEYCGRENQLK